MYRQAADKLLLGRLDICKADAVVMIKIAEQQQIEVVIRIIQVSKAGYHLVTQVEQVEIAAVGPIDLGNVFLQVFPLCAMEVEQKVFPVNAAGAMFKLV